MQESDWVAVYQVSRYGFARQGRKVEFSLDAQPGATEEACGPPRSPLALAQSLTLLTAWNPHSKPQEESWNVRANQGLEAALQAAQVEYCAAWGSSLPGVEPAWREPGFAVFGWTQATASAWGQRWGQQAVVWLDGVDCGLLFCTNAAYVPCQLRLHSSGRGLQTWPVDPVSVAQRVADGPEMGAPTPQRLAQIAAAIDLTTLQGTDTAATVRALCATARHPCGDPAATGNRGGAGVSGGELPAVAAVCVYPPWVATARRCLEASTVQVASVAGAFPSGQLPLKLRLLEVRYALEEGAQEIDLVISRALLLAGEWKAMAEEIRAVKELCGARLLKVILETGELGSCQVVRLASDLALEAGADFLKTSTGKIAVGASLVAFQVMAEAVHDHAASSGRPLGLKAAGGIRRVAQAQSYMRLVESMLGSDAIQPKRLRFGASSLLTEVVRQWKEN